MTDLIDTASPVRLVCYADGQDLESSRAFYTEVLGLEVAMEEPVLGLISPTNRTAQVLVPPDGFEEPQPRFGVDLGDPTAVEAAHDAALHRGLRVVYPLTDEPWGVRRFFVEDPSGTILNVLAHTGRAGAGSTATTHLRPRLIVPDPEAASRFYRDALGSREVFRAPRMDDGRPSAIEHDLVGTVFRVSAAVTAWGWLSPDDFGGSAVLLEVRVDDPDALGERMAAHGAEVVVPIENRPYGERAGRLRDPFGHLWIITGELR
ncbi:VOC family protein [Saccharomonospora iraqiensis]|uniref:VOC family protein n=1 Tax=Saccharomonospora iraqiensis TaxID=52698 RepID=UPI00022E11CE|nr:VOC family protein [Saccharomonospora iraqiensis]